ncbi:hypothetical protein [Brumimicrobium aurantiacum]|uniref:Lipoprotein n=1 Tax=Brumimicrobium aurantiacum TaxID=1737063 RepID=A0A3E1EXG7_9FLAO|nr:hypothetical protein [Brumimicrobium aurantiacum]RFC54163.1 hypothetical protein DXU93_09255 [Brumimicrobium aurantiacum]
MKTLLKFLLLSFLFLLALFACKKEQPEILNAEDPCDCASEVSADFVIEEYTGPISNIYVETDTSLHDSNVQFRALEDNAEYTWYIGIEEFDTKSISRYFSDQWIGHDIPITLVVKKEPNKTCLPNDDGYDSITKTFHVSKYPIYNGTWGNIEHGGLEGVYKVFGDGLSDSIEVTINFRDYFGVRTTDIGNPDGSGVNCELQNTSKGVEYWSYRTLLTEWFTSEDFCKSVGVKILNKMDGVSVLDFRSSVIEANGDVTKKEWQYKGRKLY